MFKAIKNYFKTTSSYISYTWKHKIAFLRTEYKLTGKITWRGLVHDFDKIFLYIVMSKEDAHNIHVNNARHHERNASTREDYIEMIIDWECARFTKPDKPLDAYDTLYKFYPHMVETIEPLLREFKLWRDAV